jgi:hypothetical protein
MRIRTTLFIFTFSAALFAFTACNNDNPANTQNPYAGSWDYAFTGSQVGGGQITIGSDGQFSTPVVLKDSANNKTFKYTIKATVNSSGALNGKIMQNGSQDGTLSGSFRADSGSGKWRTAPDTSGTWSADRIK